MKKFTVPLIFVWVGFVSAISFMEAWLKFLPPEVSLNEGLAIGRLVFSALNKVEWVLTILIIISMIQHRRRNLVWYRIWWVIPLLLLMLQTFWLLPALDQRAESHIAGALPDPSNLHFYYVIAEVIKVISLVLIGMQMLNTNKNFKI